MKYATIAMLCAHAGKVPKTVRRALKLAGIVPESFPGVKGGRILEKDANKFLLKHWPEVGPLNPNPVSK